MPVTSIVQGNDARKLHEAHRLRIVYKIWRLRSTDKNPAGLQF